MLNVGLFTFLTSGLVLLGTFQFIRYLFAAVYENMDNADKISRQLLLIALLMIILRVISAADF